MSAESTQKIQEQLDEWRAKLDQLRVKGSLLKMELRDKHGDVVDDVEAAYDVAKAKFLELKAAGATEADKVGAGFGAAWTAFKKAYSDATDKE